MKLLPLLAALVGAQTINSVQTPLQLSGGVLSHGSADGQAHVPKTYGVTPGYVLTVLNGGSLDFGWGPPGGGTGVTSWNGRTGVVVPATGDYTAAQVGAEPALGNPAVTGYVLSSTSAGVRSWVPQGSASVDSSRVSGLSDSAKALVRYTRITATHDTADTLRKYARDRIHDSMVVERHQDTVTASGIAHDSATAVRATTQPLDGDLTAIAALASTGYIRRTGTNTWGMAAGVPYSDLSGAVPTWNQSTTGSAAKWTTARTLTIGATGKTIDGSGNQSWSLAEIGAQVAGSYQPLEDQRLSTTNSPSLAHLTLGYGAVGSPSLVVGDNQYGIYQASSAMHLRGAAAGGIVADHTLYAPTLYEGGTSLALKYHPLENQRVGTGDSPTWNHANLGYGASGTLALQVGDGNYGLYAGGGALHLRGAAAGGIQFDQAVRGNTGAGILHSSSSGDWTSSALDTSDLPTSIRTTVRLPATQVAIGNGASGLTSSANFTADASGNTNIYGTFNARGLYSKFWNEVYMVGGGHLAGDFECSVPTRFTGAGAEVATPFTFSTSPTFSKAVSIDTLAIPHRFKPTQVVVTSSPYTLPVIGQGEQLLLVFNASTVTVVTNISQVVGYRDNAGARTSALPGGATVGGAGWFGTGAAPNVRAATLIGTNSGNAQLVF